MTFSESISVLVDDSQTAVLSINNPPANALSVSLLDALGKTVRSLNANEKIRAVVVVGGSQKFFAAGAQTSPDKAAREKRLQRMLNVVAGSFDVHQSSQIVVPSCAAGVCEPDQDVAHDGTSARDG